ncbi:hypothetical protein GC093_08185 [Paenibacillus sp. LMG 31456]|uniref:ATP-grasp domain-containing protein n=2 Tax=Paenibacillus foliorum TaxID=2654974 RepID=A0A972GST4_9BACL|nr:hypothetical protein [Paenibacillus foliorum]
MGKLGKHNFMKRYSSISKYLPDTQAATKSKMIEMLGRYGSLYLKPDEGTGGRGIYKITKTDKKYILKGGTASRSYDSFEELYRSLHNLLVKNKYVVQKSIDLLKHNKRPLDIRVMVQTNRNRQLVVTGIIGRLAKARKIVTNFHSGGTPLPIETLLQSHLTGSKRSNYIKEIGKLGKQASVVLRESYRRNKAFGVDIAIDSNLKPWILEINTRPDMSIFNALKNKTMYRKILRYSKLKG